MPGNWTSLTGRWLLAAAFFGALVPLAAADPLPKFPLIATDDCFKCHFAGGGNPAADPFLESRDFCHVEAAATWEREDKHRQSLALLLNDANRPLTERIVGFPVESVLQFEWLPAGGSSVMAIRNVRFSDPPADDAQRATYDRNVATLRQCFACHAPVEERVRGGAKLTTIENGVSCQACHGPGLGYEAPHQKPLWRLVKAADKEQEFGLRDLRNPATRIALCASCHVGTFSQDWGLVGENSRRFVRHEWYAKGHPPLPGLEFVTFAAQQPAHWRTLQEKLSHEKGFRYYAAGADPLDAADYLRFVLRTDKVQLAESYRAANPLSFSPDPAHDMARAKDVLVSGLGVLRSYAGLVQGVAGDDATWPDFAIYDCGACHHELRARLPSATRVRRSLAPGRPPPAFWTLTLARLGAGSLDEQRAATLESAAGELDAAFSSRPFGDRAAIEAAAGKLESLCDEAARALATQPLDRPAAERLLTRLVHPRHDVERDYHAARQYAWAIREVIKDLASVPHRNYALAPRDLPPPQESVIPQPLVEVLGMRRARLPAEHEQVRARIDALFDADVTAAGEIDWHQPLRLRLPAGQRQQVIGNLPAWLEAIATYDPEFFQAKLVPLQIAYPK